MDRNIKKWSAKDKYETCKNAHDVETWIYIKIDKSVKQEDMPKIVKNAELVWLDLSKYEDGVDYWTVEDIKREIS